MARLEKAFRITGQKNLTVFDAGLSSSKESQKRLIEVQVNVSGYADNTFEIWHERKQLITVPDYQLGTDAARADTNLPYSTTKRLSIPVDRDIPIGEKIQAAINCGATEKNVQGTYVYEEK